MLEVEVGAEPLHLLPEKAAYVPRHRTLLVADVHFGKAMSFRRLGVPVPQGTTAQTLAALDALIERCGARGIVFLGDFLHARQAQAASVLQALARWRAGHRGLALTLVRGNHDRHAGDPPAALGIEVVDEPFALGALQLRHHPLPAEGDGAYTLAGHLHPCVTLAGRAHDRLRLPCFHFGAKVGVLPAFGAFTGMQAVTRSDGDRVFVAAARRVVEWSAPPLGYRSA